MNDPMQPWDTLYEQSLDQNLERVRQVPGVILGIHSVIDGLKRLDAGLVESLFAGDGGASLLAQVVAAPDAPEELPREINSPADFAIALISSMKRGKALQLMIRDQATQDWLMHKVGTPTIRMGGTSGNMANSLSPMPFRKILIYANPLTKELAGLFVKSPNLYCMTDDHELKPPMEAFTGEGILALHWILEYQEGVSVDLPGLCFTTPRANRFIAAWNPVNCRLQIRESFKAGLLERASEFSHMVISGFHILSERYPDGSVWSDYLVPVGEYLKRLRAAAPSLKLHYEFASIASSKIRKGIVDYVLPAMNSLGLNEVELVAVLRDIGEQALATDIEESESIEAVYNGVRKLMELTDLDRIQLHDLGYYLALVKPEYADGATTLGGLLMAGTLAASRCKLGYIGTDEEIAQGLAEPISAKGLKRIEQLAAALGTPELAAKGYARVGALCVAMAPTKVVEKPVLTVGLGDIISSSAFILGSSF